MRSSHSALAELTVPDGIMDDDVHYWMKLEDTGWLQHVRMVLEGSLQIAAKLQLEEASALVHCSDGWDRTAQLCATTQILLDPYSRTIEGLCVLIEKDWCTFGHKFQDRIGHGDGNWQGQERSPVFLQWLEVVWQVMTQFPNCFEYTDTLLVFIADHLFSCLFGTFLGNSDKQRRQETDIHKTESLWTYVLYHRQAFLNPGFTPYNDPLWPSTSVKRIVLWDRYYCRWDMDMHPRMTSQREWRDNWGTHGIQAGLPSTPRRTLVRIPVSYPSAGTGDSGITRPSTEDSPALRDSALDTEVRLAESLNTALQPLSVRELLRDISHGENNPHIVSEFDISESAVVVVEKADIVAPAIVNARQSGAPPIARPDEANNRTGSSRGSSIVGNGRP